jgi:biopolymer transport protein ExbD
MFKKAFSRERPTGEAEINLTPCIDLLVSLISFLLMCAAFFHVRVINASVPTISDEPIQAGQSEKELNVVLQMDERGFSISGSGDNLTNEEVASVRTSIPKLGDKFNFAQLTKVLTAVKWKFPKGKSLVMVPDKTLSYEDIVLAMDAARWGDDKNGTTSSKDRQLLYPNVVLSSLVGAQ